jgi:hypothetical protein
MIFLPFSYALAYPHQKNFQKKLAKIEKIVTIYKGKRDLIESPSN